MPNYLSTNPRYFCRNVQYFSEFYSNLSFSLFFLSFELLQSSRFWQNFFVVCKCLQRVILYKRLCFRAKASGSHPLSTAERQDHPWFSFGTIFRQVRSLQAQGAPECFQHFFNGLPCTCFFMIWQPKSYRHVPRCHCRQRSSDAFRPRKCRERKGARYPSKKLQAAPRAIRRKRLHSLIFFSTQKPPRLPASETGAVRLLYGFLFALFKRSHHHLRGFLIAACAGAKIAERSE